jgi:Ca2+-binding EF-hand superfamily protein
MMGAKGKDAVTERQLSMYRRIFGFTDTNDDGQLSKKEFIDDGRYLTRQARQGIFRASDWNDNGVVSEAEYIENRIITDEAKAIFEEIDDNDDGRLTEKELIASGKLTDQNLARTVFATLDSNGNGELDVPEYLRVWGRWARTN